MIENRSRESAAVRVPSTGRAAASKPAVWSQPDMNHYETTRFDSSEAQHDNQHRSEDGR